MITDINGVKYETTSNKELHIYIDKPDFLKFFPVSLGLLAAVSDDLQKTRIYIHVFKDGQCVFHKNLFSIWSSPDTRDRLLEALTAINGCET